MCPSFHIGGVKQPAALLACPCHGPLHTAIRLQGPACHCIRGIICSDPGSSGTNHPERCPAVFEARQEGLRHLSCRTIKQSMQGMVKVNTWVYGYAGSLRGTCPASAQTSNWHSVTQISSLEFSPSCHHVAR